MSQPSDSLQSSEGESQLSAVGNSHPFRLPTECPPGVPEFAPAMGLSHPHLQTTLAAFLPSRPKLPGTVQRKLRFADGDFAVLHDDRPESWKRGDHVALLLHGLAGSHQSGYMARIAWRLMQRGVRVFRMDHRGCGAGRLLARNPYHAGRVRDLEAAIRMLERLCPGSPISVAGFSLSGNLLLRYLGGEVDAIPLSLFRAVAVCPPVDLLGCVQRLQQTSAGQRYDWYFARHLTSQLIETPLWREDLPLAKEQRPPRRLLDFDELYTAPASGFSSAVEYYETASAARVLPQIRVHTAILASSDDPMISVEPLVRARLPPNVTVCVTSRGGHLGFIGRRGVDPDRRWMDWRVVEWMLN